MKTYLKDLAPAEVIQRLQTGEEVKNDATSIIYKIVDGILCGIWPDREIEYNTTLTVCVNSNFYFETPDELKLEVGKCYKTRDGRKAFISYYDKNDNEYHGCINGKAGDMCWCENGLWYENEENDPDLISEWSDDDVAED